MAKRKPIPWRGKLVHPDAILAANPDIWPGAVAPLTRCLLAYLDGVGPGHQEGVIHGPLNQIRDDLERIAGMESAA
jgi:hypothetical protein